MMKKMATGFLALCLLLIPAISCSQPGPTLPAEVKNEDEARGAAISYVQANYEEATPPPGGDWQGKDVTPEGLLGRRTVEFTLDDWKVVVSHPVVAPENIKYEVTVRNTDSCWYWRGIVEPDGHVSELVPFQQITQDKSRQIAEEFMKNSPTFIFDGIENSLELVETLYPDIENAWQFVFQFESRHAGYGDRTGEMLAQVITPHEAIITVEQGEIRSAIMDGKWDMINQRMLEGMEIALAPIHEVEVSIMESYPVQVGVYIKGGLRDGCTSFHDAIVTREGNTVNIEVTTQRPRDAICSQVYSFFEENLNLGSGFTAGTTYTLKVNDYTTTLEIPQ